jgi:putative FmdB family regulatory protein
MPVYIYHCDQCNKDVEITKPMSKAVQKETCICGTSLRRVYNALAVCWGGSCWTYDKDGLGDKLVLSHH